MAPRIAVLGTIEVDGTGDAGALTRRDRVVLGALTTSHGESLTVDQLSDALWGDEPPKSSAKVVQGSVMRLRRLLGNEAIETTGAGYRLTLDGDTVDAHAFERLVGRARELASVHEPERAASAYEQALALWRGAPLPELQEWDPGRAEAERLLEVRRSVEEELVEARMDCGLVAAAVADAQHLVRREPYREHRWALLALALYRSGRQREALDAIRRARTTLIDELGLDPGPELVTLEQRILQQDAALLDVPEEPATVSSTCPWPGLRPFDSDQAELYAGREADVQDCLARLAAYPLLLVVGASGSGKSSLVRAGVVPRLMTAGAAVAITVPGATPLASLTAELAGLSADAVLVVDQLEELVASSTSTVGYLDRLAAEVEAGRRVVVTLRADHLGALAASASFARAAERGLLLLAPMDEQQLREAIEVPARLSGLRLETGLADLLLRDVGGDAGGLPLLSHALAETWARRDGAVLTVAGYHATGGINGAVAQSAERLYESLAPDDREALRSVLQRLVTPTPAGDPVAARVPTRVFDGTDDAPRLLDLLVRARLVTASADSATLAHESLVRAWPRLRTWLDEDVEGQRVFAHLQVAADGWDAGGRPDDELYRGARLETALEWRERTHPVLAEGEVAFLDASAAYAESEERRRTAELAAQKRSNRQLRGALAGVVGLLVLALVAGSLAVVRGRQAQDSAAAAEASARLTDAARLSAASRSEKQIDLALLMARQAVQTDDSAQRQAELLSAITRADVVSTVQADPMLVPDQRIGDTMTRDGSHYLVSSWPTDVRVVDTRKGRSVAVFLGRDDLNYGHYTAGAGFYDHDRKVAIMSDDNAGGKQLVRIDVATGKALAPAETVPQTRSFSFNGQDKLHITPDGARLVSFGELGGRQRVLRVWDRVGSAWRGPRAIVLPTFPPSVPGQDFLGGVSFSDDSRYAALSVEEQGPPIWATRVAIAVDLVSGRAMSPWVVEGMANAVAPDGRTWAVARFSGAVEIRSLADPSRPVITIPTPPQSSPWSLTWSADSRYLGVGGLDGSLAVYDTDPPSASRFGVAGLDDRLDLALVRQFAADGQAVEALAITPDGIVTSVQDGGRITRRSIFGSNALLTLAPTKTAVSAVSAGPPGTVVAAGMNAGLVEVLDQGTMRRRQLLTLGPFTQKDPSLVPDGHRRVTAVAVTPDGAAVIAGNRAGVLRAWSVADGRRLWSESTGPIEQLAVSPDGKWLATVESVPVPEGVRLPDGPPATTTFTLWDLSTHRPVFRNAVQDPDKNVPKGKMLVFSPDSSLVAVPFMGPSIVQVYQVAEPRLLYALQDAPIGSQFGPIAVTFTPDGSTLLVRTDRGDAILPFDPRTGAAKDGAYTEPGDAGYGNLAFRGDGAWLFSRSPFGLSAFDTQSRRLLLRGFTLASDRGEGSMAVVPDGYLYAATDTGVARLDVDPTRWDAVACRLAGRTLTEEEWGRLLPGQPYAPACASTGAPSPTDPAAS